MRPTEALSLGLIDAAESPTTAVASFVAELGNSADEPTTDDSQEEVEMAEISSEDRATIANETRERIKGIMTHEEAKGRESLAEHLAYETDNTVEQAAAILKASPKAEAPKEEPKDEPKDEPKGDDEGKDDGDKAKGKSQFEQAMDQGKHPEVGPDGKGGGGDGDAVSANVSRILGAQAAATGRKFETAKA